MPKNYHLKCTCNHNIGHRKQQKPAYHISVCKFVIIRMSWCTQCTDTEVYDTGKIDVFYVRSYVILIII